MTHTRWPTLLWWRSTATLAFVAALGLPGCKATTDDPGPRSEPAKASARGTKTAKIGVTCRPDHEVDAPTRNAVETEARRIYADVHSGRLDAVWEALHPRARLEDEKISFMEALQSMHGRVRSIEVEPGLDSLHVVEVRGGAEDLARVLCPGTQRTEHFTMYTNVAGEDLAVVILRVEDGAFGLGATVQLRKSEGRWRLVGIQVNPVSYQNKDARQWEAIADGYWRSDKPMPAYLALGVAQTLSTRAATIETESKTRINEKLETLREDAGFAEDTSSWAIDGERYELAGVSLASTRSDISPVFKYVSSGDLERSALEREVDVLVAHLRGLHPELSEIFDAVVFEAYAEAPTEPGRTYDGYRLARFLDPDRPSPED